LRKVDSPAYADLDWKMALADEVEKAHEGEEPAPEPVVIQAEEAPVESEESQPVTQVVSEAEPPSTEE
jgi:hypothetical protein